MKTPFQLDQHPRRPQPLSEPPADYFDQLPMRVMARLPRPAAAAETGWSWWARLSAGLRTSLAASAVLGGFAAVFWLSAPLAPTPWPATPTGTAAALDAVPHAELVDYLLEHSGRVEATDLAVLTAADPTIAQSFLHASPDELTDALDAYPVDEAAYL